MSAPSEPRDPRVDPRKGDVLRQVAFNAESFQQIEITHGGRVVLFVNSNDGPRGGFYIGQFRRWARGAEIVRRGE